MTERQVRGAVGRKAKKKEKERAGPRCRVIYEAKEP